MNHLRVDKWAAFLLVLTWAVTVCALFSYGELFPAFRHLLHLGGSLLLLLFLCLIAYLSGKALFRLIKVELEPLIEELVFCTALGLGLMAYLVFIAGICGLLYKGIMWGLLGVLLIFGAREIPRTFQLLKGRSFPKIEGGFQIFLSVLFITTVLVNFVWAQCPPLNYDTLSYHLGIPKHFINQGKITYIPGNIYSNFPLTMELLYLLSLLLKGDILAKLLHLAAGLLTALGIYSFTRRHFGKKSALLSSVIFYNIPIVGMLSGYAFNDLTLTLFIFLACISMLRWFTSGQNPWLISSGIFCGLSMGTKYTGFLFCLFPLVAAICLKVLFIDKNRLAVCLKRTALFLVISITAASPWLVKNAIYTHNPVYPFFYSIFSKSFGHPGGEIFDIDRFASHHSAQNTSPGHILRLPLKLSMNNQFGLVLLVLLPALLFVRGVDEKVKLCLCYGGLYFLLWAYLTHQNNRFFLPALPTLSICAGYAVKRLEGERPLAHLFNVIIPAIMLFNFYWLPLSIANYGVLKVACGIETRDNFLARSPLYQYSAFQYINENLPASSKLLFIGENQGYYCNREFVSNSPLDTNIIVKIANVSDNEEEMLTRLKKMGITHILYNASEVKRVSDSYNSFNWASPESRRRFIKLLWGGQLLEEIYSRNGVFIYRVIY